MHGTSVHRSGRSLPASVMDADCRPLGDTTPATYADTISRLRLLADLYRLPLFGESWAASLFSLEQGASSGLGLLVEDSVYDHAPSCRASICKVAVSLAALSRDATLRHLPAEECARLALVERSRHRLAVAPLRRALTSLAARLEHWAMRRWASAARRLRLAAAGASGAPPPAEPAAASAARRAPQYAALAGVIWDVAVRSTWRRGFGPWAAQERSCAARAARLRASMQRRCLNAAWLSWRRVADDVYGERTLGGIASLSLRALRARSLVRHWRVFSRCSAQLRRSRGRVIPRRRCVEEREESRRSEHSALLPLCAPQCSAIQCSKVAERCGARIGCGSRAASVRRGG